MWWRECVVPKGGAEVRMDNRKFILTLKRVPNKKTRKGILGRLEEYYGRETGNCPIPLNPSTFGKDEHKSTEIPAENELCQLSCGTQNAALRWLDRLELKPSSKRGGAGNKQRGEGKGDVKEGRRSQQHQGMKGIRPRKTLHRNLTRGSTRKKAKGVGCKSAELVADNTREKRGDKKTGKCNKE